MHNFNLRVNFVSDRIGLTFVTRGVHEQHVISLSLRHPGQNQALPMAKYVPGKNIFCSMNKEKARGERIFEIVHCPFKGRADMHH